MSRIGKKPIAVPSNVKVAVNGQEVRVEGPRGKLVRELRPEIEVRLEDGALVVEPRIDNRVARGLFGLSRTLLNNMVNGVTTGFQRVLQIEGVGYRCEVKGNAVTFNLGYSHPIIFPLPEGISAKEEDRGTKVTFEGMDKELLGQTVAKIRRLRPPEPYKGKGIRYSDERIRRKVGKSG